MTTRERAEELGYTYNCYGCGRKSDTPNCGCVPTPEETEAQALRPALEALNEALDELSSEAIEVCGEAKTLLDLAWWFTEDQLRDQGPGSCGHKRAPKDKYCACCAHYDELKARAQHARRTIF